MKQIDKIQHFVFHIVHGLIWFLYIVVAFGVSVGAPEYLHVLESYMKIYVSLFLIYRFNPFRRVTFTSLDTEIAFSAGVFLLATTAINNILESHKQQLKEFIISVFRID